MILLASGCTAAVGMADIREFGVEANTRQWKASRRNCASALGLTFEWMCREQCLTPKDGHDINDV